MAAGAPPAGGGEDAAHSGGAEEAAREHDGADDRDGAEAEHDFRQVLQGPAGDFRGRGTVYVKLAYSGCKTCWIISHILYNARCVLERHKNPKESIELGGYFLTFYKA